MPTTARTRNPIVALLGAVAIVSAVVFLGGRSGTAAGAEQPPRRTVPTAFDRDTDPHQSALHHVTTTPGGLALRPSPSDGGVPFAGAPVIASRTEGRAATALLAHAGENRPPLRVLFCTWLI
ncbi:hypothetical protein [Frigoriglobus tundricola]|uniref:Uncharacterized protein n=1 Tax=Frigoriglobus tundricola TaxID=2774151 RepID=A0A6M5YMP1_9BACT|nr:hypothetical protein [Frigoriglobus tundricola]QJW94563.1 hypothetical protein FTUN_2084 [Frigoriglobus tundricola]